MKAGSNNSPTAQTAQANSNNNGSAAAGGQNGSGSHGNSNTPAPNSNQGPAPPNTTIGHYIIGKQLLNPFIDRAVREGARKGHIRLGKAGNSYPHRRKGKVCSSLFDRLR